MDQPTVVEGTCHCGAVTIAIPEAPAQLTSCNCSLCRRLGGLWCYFPPAQVRITGATTVYCWGDRAIDIHHCATCACTTHWTPREGTNPDRMGINARMMPPAIVAAARIRRIDGADTWKWLD